ncbi:uncharacterized protein LOC129585549 [Paramacrobiotus metropolitanus]|uniref:uncharacterized protein LOC129585549 n=1 Tax=Paramacrobiotus metropolitanus TaxID=2943436 RepID=UPI002445E9B7|nr:uncharacterized protein LOC129585549 [Paramacrobiotus metropolitanus]
MAESDVCCVLQCPLSEPSRSMRSVCFFAFPHPSDPRYPVWIERTLHSKDRAPSAASRICSRHFRSSDIVILASAEYCEEPEKRLKHDALPCLFEGIPRSMQPPVESVPRSHSPDIAVSSVLEAHRPIESAPRPDSPEIAVLSTKKRSKDSCLSTLQPPPTKVARVDEETTERRTACPKATPSAAEACAAALASTAQMLHFPSPDILFRPHSSDKPVAAEPLPLLPQSAVAALPSRNSPKQPESRGEVGSLVDLPDRSPAQPVSAADDADTLQMCCVPGCSITSQNAAQTGDTLFPFLLPEHKLYDVWVKRIRCTTSWQPQPPSFICSRHFLRSDIKTCRISTNAKKAPFPTVLRDNAVPCRSACIAAFHFSGVRDGETENAQSVAEVQSCRACGAKRNGWTKPAEMLVFYPFPSARHLNSLWTGFLPDQGRRELTTEPAVVCQNHFAPEDFETSGVLKSNAVPAHMLIFRAKDRYKLTDRKVRKEADSKAPKEGTVCCVPGCRIPAEELGSGRITYMHFPLDPARRDEWIRCIRCAVSWAPRRGFDMVCSRHFTAQDFSHSVVNKITGITSSRLKQSAVPSKLDCVGQFRTPISTKIPLIHPKILHKGVQCCCLCRWWRLPEPVKRSERLAFFSFPKLVAQRQLWITACRELSPEFVFTVGSLVCENHFKPDDVTWGKSKLILKPTAVPSVRTPNELSSPVLESGIFEEQHAFTNGDVAATDAGLPVAVGDKTNNLETVGDLRVQSHENDHIPMETDAPSANKDPSASLQLCLPAASRNGLPEDKGEENSFDHLLVTSPLPDIQVPSTIRGRVLIETPTIITASAPSDTSIYCEPCCKLMQAPCWIHAVNVPDEPVIPLAVGSLPKVLNMDVCDESPTGKAVFARETLVRHTVFGPLIAPTVSSDDEKARYVDVSDVGEDAKRKQYQLDSDYLCNWMKHVRLADSVEASNLLVFARGCEIVFVTNRTISPHEELRVWYSRQYLDLLNPAASQNVDSDGEIPGVEDERRKLENIIMEEPCPDYWDEKILEHLSLQRDFVTSTASSDQDSNSEANDGQNDIVDGDICEELFRIYSISDGEIVDNTPVPNNSGSSQLTPQVKPPKNAPARKKVRHGTSQPEKPLAGALVKVCRMTLPRHTFTAAASTRGQGKEPFQCTLCDKSFSLQSTLRAHEKLHQPAAWVSDSLTCEKCGLRFRSHMLSQLHGLRHRWKPSGNNVERELTCPKCGDMFDKWEELMDHVEEHGRPTEKCRICDQRFENLDAHLRLGNCGPFSQLECSSDLDAGRAGLMRSSSTNHKSSSEHYLCQDCGKEFEHQSGLAEHQKKHLNLTFNKSFTCDGCGMRFATESLRQVHILQHGNIVSIGNQHPRERRCPHCNKSFKNLRELVVHVDEHGRTTDKCSHCNRWFGHLPGHMRLNHPASLSNSVDGRNQSGQNGDISAKCFCDVCDGIFLTKELLMAHAKEHNSDRDICKTLHSTLENNVTVCRESSPEIPEAPCLDSALPNRMSPSSRLLGNRCTRKRSADSCSPRPETPPTKTSRVGCEVAAPLVIPSSDSLNHAENVGSNTLLVDFSHRSLVSVAGDADTLRICCVPGCSITSRNASQTGDTIFPFLLPEHELYDTWVERIRCTTSWQPQPASFICSQHFEHADMVGYRSQSGKAMVLKADASPSRLACVRVFHHSGLRGGEMEDARSILEMRACQVCGAKRKRWTKPSERLMFYAFPTDTRLKSLWMQFLTDQGRRKPVTEKSLVCQNHFAPEEFETGGTLKVTAVPSRMWTFGPMSKGKETDKRRKPVSAARISSFLSNPDNASHNGLPGDGDSVVTALAKSALPEVAVDPRTRSGNAVKTALSALAITDPDNALLYCESCSKVMQTPCWMHSDSIPDEPVIPLAVGSLPRVLYMDVCDESPTGVEAERMSDNVIKEESCPDHWDEEIVYHLSLKRDLVTSAASSDPDDDTETPDGKNSTLDGEIGEELFRICSISDGEIVDNAPVPNNIDSSLLSPKRHRPAVAQFYSCSDCGLRFTNKSVLEVHRFGYQPAGAAGNQDSVQNCPECGVAFHHLGDLIQHVDLHGEITHRCPVCDLRCPVPDLKQHIARCHPQFYAAEKTGSVVENARSVRSVTCSECGLQFPSALLCSVHKTKHDLQKLLVHIDVHAVPTQNTRLCGKNVAVPELPVVMRHDLQHDSSPTGKPLAGTLLKLHQPATHESLTCKDCGLRFRSHVLSRLHRLKHQGNPSGSIGDKELTCPKCGDAFDKWKELMDHVEEHGRPTEKCRVCGQWFDSLDAHLRQGQCGSSSQLECSISANTGGAGLRESST